MRLTGLHQYLQPFLARPLGKWEITVLRPYSAMKGKRVFASRYQRMETATNAHCLFAQTILEAATYIRSFSARTMAGH